MNRIRAEVPSETMEWSAFKNVIRELKGRWHFRGAIDNWDLEPSLEHTARDWDIPACDLPSIEIELLRDFKRAYPMNASVSPPRRDDNPGWLALMQHYGAPTRLLDWTYSPYVAAFFALDTLLGSWHAHSGVTSGNEERMAAVWALSIEPLAKPQDLFNSDVINKAFEEFGGTRSGKSFAALYLASPPLSFVGCVNPWQLNERLGIQQGLFLCPGNSTLTFEEDLRRMPDALKPGNLRRFLLPRRELGGALADLHRMNINHASLFPGVEGYARRLRHRMDFLRQPAIYKDTML